MTVFVVDTYVIKPEKQAEYTAWSKKFFAYKERNPQLFKEVKSYKVFAHVAGGNWGGYVEMLEFESLADFEKWMNRITQSEYMTTLYPEFTTLVAPATESVSIWNPVK
jgi:antibiotic biosynthesis monooxygenase (ABM) superfamily enzyme